MEQKTSQGLSPDINPMPVSSCTTNEEANSASVQPASEEPKNRQNPEVVETVVTEVSTAPKQPKKSRAPIFCAIFFAILAIAGVSFGVYFYLDANNKAVDNAKLRAEIDLLTATTGAELVTEQQGNTAVTTVANPDNHISEVKEVVDELYDAVQEADVLPHDIVKIYGDMEYGDNQLSEVEISDNAYAFLEESYGIYSKVIQDSARSFPDTEPYSKANAIIVAKLKELGFNESASFISSTVFTDSDRGIVCSVGDYNVNTVCGHSSWISDESVASLDALAKAYFDKANNHPIRFSSAYNIEDSKI